MDARIAELQALKAAEEAKLKKTGAGSPGSCFYMCCCMHTFVYLVTQSEFGLKDTDQREANYEGKHESN